MLTVDDMGNYGVPSRLVTLLFPVIELILIIRYIRLNHSNLHSNFQSFVP
jgi:hypothetical protein